MAKLEWSVIGQRYYESGVDRGVLYVNDSGIAWSGLVSITESASGGEPRPYYIDGVKYLNLASVTEYAATLNAFSAPAEFDVCDGTVSISNGLFVTNQTRRPFGLSYRSKVGNDTDGPDFAYKLHVVYNALAAPTERTYKTLSDSPELIELSWSLTTKPPVLTGYKPTAHFVIDSRTTPARVLDDIERILYGTETLGARLPSATELMEVFQGQLALQLVEIQPGVWELVVATIDSANVIMRSIQPIYNGETFLWLDTSEGDYAIPTLVTGG